MGGTGFRPPVTLSDEYLSLVPLSRDLVPELAVAGRDPEVWRYLRIGPGRNEAEMGALVDFLLQGQTQGDTLPFVVRLRANQRVVGILRYFHIERAHRSVELGTWLSSDVWRSPVNTHAKFLALRYAFEEEGAHRVALKTHLDNERSARAIERLGAVREGVLRAHVRAPDGQFTSSIVYSILISEWPEVRAALERKRARPWAGRTDLARS